MPAPIYSPASTGGYYATQPVKYNWNALNRAMGQFRGSQSFGPQVAMQLFKASAQSQEEARRINEQRYGDILGGYRERYGEAMGLLEGQGAQQRKDLERQYKNAQAAGMQQAVSSGLGGTLRSPLLQLGYERQYADAAARLEEGLRRERLGYQTQLSGDALQFMERREDSYPYMQDLMNLGNLIGQMPDTAQPPRYSSYTISPNIRSYPGSASYGIGSQLGYHNFA